MLRPEREGEENVPDKQQAGKSWGFKGLSTKAELV